MKKCSGRIQTAILSAAMCMALAGSMTAGAAESSVKDEDSVKTQASGTEAAAPSEEVTLNFWHHYSAQSPENETLMNDLIPKFERYASGRCKAGQCLGSGIPEDGDSGAAESGNE